MTTTFLPKTRRHGLGLYPDMQCFNPNRASWLPYWINDTTEQACMFNANLPLTSGLVFSSAPTSMPSPTPYSATLTTTTPSAIDLATGAASVAGTDPTTGQTIYAVPPTPQDWQSQIVANLQNFFGQQSAATPPANCDFLTSLTNPVVCGWTILALTAAAGVALLVWIRR